MPVLARRRLCKMLSELSQHMLPAKLNEYLSRLDHTNTKTALAAEGELVVLWAISRVAHLVPEPTLPGSRQSPDAASNDLFASGPSVIEVRALSDDSFSGKEAMDRTANIIASYADRLRKGAGRHLYFEFLDRSYWTRRFHRERCVDPAFRLSCEVKSLLQHWITAPDWPNPECIKIAKGKTDVVISWKPFPVRYFRTFCRMPPVAYDLEDNPVYKALRKKAKQLKGVPPGTRRCVVLVDAGCYLLRQLRPMGGVHEIGGEAIIRHALVKLSIDTVIVLSPYKHRQPMFGVHTETFWNVRCYDGRANVPKGEYDRVSELAAQLPKPHYEGYQARDIHKQSGFAQESRRWYLPTHLTTFGRGNVTIKLSAGLLHEYLAGRIDNDRFRQEAFNNDKNIFDLAFAQGHTITAARFEPGGIDEDDDYVVFDLDFDWHKLMKNKYAPSPETENKE